MKNNYIVFHTDDLILSYFKGQFIWSIDYNNYFEFEFESAYGDGMLIIGGYKSFHTSYRNRIFNMELYNFCLPHKNRLLLVPVNNSIFDFTKAIKI